MLADPVATMLQGTTTISTNNNWTGADISSRAAQVGAFPLAAGSLDAALAVSPAPQSYSVQITGSNTGKLTYAVHNGIIVWVHVLADARDR